MYKPVDSVDKRYVLRRSKDLSCAIKDAGYTQKEFAKAAGISMSNIKSATIRRFTISAATAQAISDQLGIDKDIWFY